MERKEKASNYGEMQNGTGEWKGPSYFMLRAEILSVLSVMMFIKRYVCPARPF